MLCYSKANDKQLAVFSKSSCPVCEYKVQSPVCEYKVQKSYSKGDKIKKAINCCQFYE